MKELLAAALMRVADTSGALDPPPAPVVPEEGAVGAPEAMVYEMISVAEERSATVLCRGQDDQRPLLLV